MRRKASVAPVVAVPVPKLGTAPSLALLATGMLGLTAFTWRRAWIIYCRLVPLTAMSTLRLPHPEQTSRSFHSRRTASVP